MHEVVLAVKNLRLDKIDGQVVNFDAQSTWCIFLTETSPVLHQYGQRNFVLQMNLWIDPLSRKKDFTLNFNIYVKS